MKTISLKAIAFFFIFLLITTCKKDEKTVTVFEVTDLQVTDNSVRINGKITSLSGNDITDYGVCYSIRSNPVATDTALHLGVPEIGNFTASINNLRRNKTYNFKGFIKEAGKYLYDDNRSAKIEAILPTASTAAAGSVAESSAVINGSVNANGVAVTVSFEYGTTTAYGSVITASQSPVTGTSATNVTATLSGLASNTAYHFRVKAVNAAGTVYGEDMSFTTTMNLVAPSSTTLAATSIANTTATINGSINANGSNTTISFEYGISPVYGSTIDASPASASSVVPVSVSAALTGLVPGQLYHFRVKAVSAGGTTNGEDLTFTTTQPPAATTQDATNISASTATLNGQVNAYGTSTAISFEYGVSTSYGNTADAVPSTLSVTGLMHVQADIAGLSQNTTYHFRVKAVNSGGTSYGIDLTFSTSPQIATATVITSAVTGITADTAIGGGNITSDGGSAVIYRGICYSTTPNPTIDDYKTINGTGSGIFTSPFSNLSPSTLYYVRAYATNIAGTAYGNEVSFTSGAPNPDPPIVTTSAISGITHNSASAGGNITSDGGATVSARGICWSTSGNPTILDSKTTNGTGTGSFTSSMTSLSASTIYHVRAYATNSAGTSYGDDVSFTTSDPPAGLATLTTLAASAITSSTASTGGNISNDGGAGVTTRGVCWGTTTNPDINGSKTSDGAGSGSFTSTLTGLNYNTTYHIRAYATNSAGTAYGDDKIFTTPYPDPIYPTVSTSAASSITYNSATGNGNVTADGFATVTERGMCWSTTQNPTTVNSKAAGGSGTGSFTASMTGLTASTTYYARAYAINSVGTAYGTQVSFTTSALPFTVTTTSASSVTSNSASTGGTISNPGGATITSGVCYGTSPNPTVSGNKTTDGSASGTYISNLTGLSASTLYYVRAYATNPAGTAYGNQISFTTPALVGYPVISTSSVTTISTNSGVSGGNSLNASGGNILAKGICWGMSLNPTTTDSKTSDGTGTSDFSSNITGLIPCTTYHVRAYATNEIGTSYGADIMFTTVTTAASVSTTSISGISSTSASSGGTLSGDCTSGVTARGVCWSTSTGPTADLATKTVNGTGGGAFTSSITGLTPCVTYYVRAYATNAAGTSYGNEVSFTTSAAQSTVSTTTITGVTAYGANSGGSVTGDCIGGVTARGIIWSTSSSPTVDLSTKTVNGSGGGSFSSTMTGLTACTYYYVRAYATNSAGTSYGNQLTFTTSAEAVTLATTAISGITSSTASSGGTISGICSGTVTERGVCWNTLGSPTTANSRTINGTGTGSFTSSLSGLAYNTTYYVRAYATNPAGTFYGDQISFTTLPLAPTVSTTTVTVISARSTITGGNVTNDYGGAVSERGVCWNTTGTPTTADSKLTNGTGTGAYTIDISSLLAGSTYYLRAYAINSGGTGYGTPVTISVPSTVSDVDGNIYSTVKINGQTWMQENLKATSSNDGLSLYQFYDTASVGYYYYHSYANNASYGTTYGYMYNGFVVGGTRNICPVGWHVPTYTDWTSLRDFLGGSSFAGGKLNDLSIRLISKFPVTYGYSYWNNSMTGHTNDSRFYARGGGYYLNTYVNMYNTAIWWISNKQYVRIDYNNTNLTITSSTDDDNAFYVRCKKD